MDIEHEDHALLEMKICPAREEDVMPYISHTFLVGVISSSSDVAPPSNSSSLALAVYISQKTNRLE